MMIAFSVASETRYLKHAYAMRARIQSALHFLVWMLLAVATVQGRTEQDEQEEPLLVLDMETEATTDTPELERSQNKRMKNIESLQENCEFRREVATCRGFNYDEPEEMAFFSLSTHVRIAPDGASYELDGQQPLVTLIMENSTFVNCPLHLFYELPLLSELDMRNSRMQFVAWECFLSANKLKILLLSNNVITELDERTFAYASELEFLFLNANQLSSMHADAFKGLHKLRHLDLSDNQLEALPDRLFNDLTTLQHLTIANNRLGLISNAQLMANVRLQTVILSWNRLRQLGEYAFSSAEQLMLLDVSHNAPLTELVMNIKAGHLLAQNCSLFRVNIFGAVANVVLSDNRVEELYFSAPEALEDLLLRNNSLVQLATLSSVPRLRRLNLANNPHLRELPEDWQNLQLARLDLSNTGLQQLPQAVLHGMPQLRSLNVSVNNISEIDPRYFAHLSQLTHLFIHENNWNCFSLRMVMDILILPHSITYTPDKFNANFPGSYIHDIACMYQLPEEEQIKPDLSASSSSASLEYSQYSETRELAKLREELKAVVQHFEQKFDGIYAQLKDLNNKINHIEHINSSLWNQMAIIV